MRMCIEQTAFDHPASSQSEGQFSHKESILVSVCHCNVQLLGDDMTHLFSEAFACI